MSLAGSYVHHHKEYKANKFLMGETGKEKRMLKRPELTGENNKRIIIELLFCGKKSR